MSQIHVLPPHLVNMIAAGEVIERPASVVKELVENAIDAGGMRIDVSAEAGGKRLIAITDDGTGMSAGDAALAFMPHATSKITTDEDLFRIATMGFRGEALASIASISHAHIRTRRREDDHGYEVEASADTVGEVRPCAAGPGTTVTIRDLFFNTPARRKFLKADSTEIGHISEALARIALPQKDIAFTLTHNARRMLDLPRAETLRQRVTDLFGKELTEDLLEIPPQADEIIVTGLIGTPASARPTARWQYFFLNGRFIRDRYLGHALKEAYRGLIDPQRQATAFIFIDLPPENVDVNVHPTKVEVRFRDGQSVHSHVLAALRLTLQRAELRPTIRLPEDRPDQPVGEGEMPPDDERRRSLREAMADFFKSQPAPPPQPPLSFPSTHDRPERAEPPREGTSSPRPAGQPPRPPYAPPPGDRTWDDFPTTGQPSAQDSAFTPPGTREPGRPGEVAPPASTVEVRTGPQALQVHDTYIVIGDEDGIVIIDQHALHERILYDQLMRRITSGTMESQRLLLPATLKITPDRRALIEEHHDLLDKVGIEVSEFGPDTVAIHRFPTLLGKVDPAGFVSEALDRLAEDASASGEHMVHDLLAMMSCKAAVKAGDTLTPEEIRTLLDRRSEANKPTACPHGRPTQIRLTIKDLEKQFKRI